jgi:ABC-type multidrug transport system fused ATPase/permease subunit
MRMKNASAAATPSVFAAAHPFIWTQIVFQAFCSVVQSVSPYLFIEWLDFMFINSGGKYWTDDSPALAYMTALIIINALFICASPLAVDVLYSAMISLQRSLLLRTCDRIDETAGVLASKIEKIWLHSERYMEYLRRLVDNSIKLVGCCVFIFIASPKVGALLVLPLLLSNSALLVPYSVVLKRLDSASIACRAHVNEFLHERMKFNRTVMLCGQSSLELKRLDKILELYESSTMATIRSAIWIFLGLFVGLSRQAVVAYVAPFLLLWLHQESGLGFKSIWLISVYMQLIAIQAETLPSNVSFLLSSYNDIKQVSSRPPPSSGAEPGRDDLTPTDSDVIPAVIQVAVAGDDEPKSTDTSPISATNHGCSALSGSSQVLVSISDGEFAPILSGLHIRIPLHKVTVIYGPSGSGVSLSLSLSLYYFLTERFFSASLKPL